MDVRTPAPGVSCSESQNLLVDTRFQNLGQGSWAYVQHSGPQSFSFTSEQGELELARTGDEPWMLLTQQVALPALDPDKRHTLVLSAELKGDVPTEPELHGFEHKADMYAVWCASMAEHEPNSGVWDWQRIDISVAVLSGKTRVQAGFYIKVAVPCGRAGACPSRDEQFRQQPDFAVLLPNQWQRADCPRRRFQCQRVPVQCHGLPMCG